MWYRVEFADPEEMKDGDDILFGRITYSNGLIEIRRGMSYQQMLQTLIHEILHAILIHMGNPKTIDEGSVDGLAYGLLDFLNDNRIFANLIFDLSFQQGQ